MLKSEIQCATVMGNMYYSQGISMSQSFLPDRDEFFYLESDFVELCWNINFHLPSPGVLELEM